MEYRPALASTQHRLYIGSTSSLRWLWRRHHCTSCCTGMPVVPAEYRENTRGHTLFIFSHSPSCFPAPSHVFSPFSGCPSRAHTTREHAHTDTHTFLFITNIRGQWFCTEGQWPTLPSQFYMLPSFTLWTESFTAAKSNPSLPLGLCPMQLSDSVV